MTDGADEKDAPSAGVPWRCGKPCPHTYDDGSACSGACCELVDDATHTHSGSHTCDYGHTWG